MGWTRGRCTIRRIYTNHLLCSGCRACSVACTVAHFGVADDSRGAIQILRDPLEGYEFQAVCRLCEDPECVAACMAVALSIEPDTGRVVFDRDRCVGCAMCVMVCPHHAVVPDWRAGKAIICDQCEGRDMPACVVACATGAVEFVEVEEAAKLEK
ncbi:MAG: hypothetical protein GTO51_05125 [Candidatus Latescibacteria bacterium]|nr:hypothetical protein [Candidatus Latescibacterota bacterium]NIO28384.1 hypothetical protein [Candidatus Latescibacterota bacterium]NIO55933.1 hypothetical protein [Candidatus Latescibacterota bacterium]NIT01897.1 hypothetical protein [Candidatus Latescibacterota bacterium]